MQPSGVLQTVILAALILFALYRRFRRTIGRQKLSRGRLLVRVVLLIVVVPLVLAPLAPSLAAGLTPLIGALLGLGVGALAALYGLRLTRFERNPEGTYFTPNTYVGLAVYALFLARLVYRFVYILSTSAPGSPSAPSSPPVSGGGYGAQAFDPVTVGILFVFLGYNLFYYLGVLRRSRELSRGDSTSGEKLG